ncbi:hypothetical protein SAMN05216550_117176 [Paraburkholderia tropica]|uniref:Uncharacterized protein n=2 Tax=Paraburkholderia tropica TaxID=92647 RepID=A0AAQ1GL52_9BURK|nr:hypothetical protein SAMN05216550_117176 [Paraburkholderia tropica]
MACRQLASGNGSPTGFAQLFEAIYCTYFVHFATEGRYGLEMFREAERELGECYTRAKAEGRFDTVPGGMAAIQKVLLLRDEQFRTVPSHFLDAAQERFLRYVRSDGDDSPIVSEPDCENSPSL